MVGGAACGCGSFIKMGCFSRTLLKQQPVLAVTSSSYVDLMTCKGMYTGSCVRQAHGTGTKQSLRVSQARHLPRRSGQLGNALWLVLPMTPKVPARAQLRGVHGAATANPASKPNPLLFTFPRHVASMDLSSSSLPTYCDTRPGSPFVPLVVCCLQNTTGHRLADGMANRISTQ